MDNEKAKCKCSVCGKEMEYTIIPEIPFAHPTLCPECNAKRKEEEKEREVQKSVERMNAEVEQLPYPDWDCSIGNNRLRNTIGTSVFKDKHLTGKSLYIHGETGCGKTRSVCSVARTIIERDDHVKYIHCLRMLSGYSNEFVNGGAEEYLTKLGRDKRIIIVDDLGVGRVTERGAELLYYLIDERLINKLPTWITSNLEPKYLGQWFPEGLQDYSDRITRRIYETYNIIDAKRV